MKQIWIWAALCCASSVVIAQSQHVKPADQHVQQPVPGERVAQQLGHFDALVVQTTADVRYVVSNKNSVTVRGANPAAAGVQIGVQPVPGEYGNAAALTIRAEKNGPQHGIEVVVMGPSPKLIYASGTGDIEVEGVSGNSVQVVQKGTGDIRVNGRVNRVEVQLMGSGDIHLEELQAESAKVQLNGSGDVDLQASKTLQVDLRGAGDVNVRGNPSSRQISNIGAGEVTYR